MAPRPRGAKGCKQAAHTISSVPPAEGARDARCVRRGPVAAARRGGIVEIARDLPTPAESSTGSSERTRAVHTIATLQLGKSAARDVTQPMMSRFPERFYPAHR